MTVWLLLSVLVSFVIGLLTVLLLWPRSAETSGPQFVVKCFLALGLGQGITSCLVFLYLLVNGRADTAYCWYELGLACALGLFLLKVRKAEPRAAASPRVAPYAYPLLSWNALLAAAFYATAGLALASVALELWRAPHGGWDAWAIWNSRARALFRGGDQWRDAFSVHVRLHADYPLLLPLSVVRGWIYVGRETTAVPALLAWLFTAGIVGLLTSAVTALRDRPQGYLAGVVLLACAFFVTHASTQFAEAPLMFFYLAGGVLIAFHLEGAGAKRGGALVLAGLAAALAAWTKNEGLLFVLALGGAYYTVLIVTRGCGLHLGQLLPLGAGLLPVLAIVIYFKTQFAPPNDLIASISPHSTLTQLSDPGRYVFIAKQIAWRWFDYSGMGIKLTYLLLIFMVCVGVTRKRMASVQHGALVLALLLAGLVWIYLTTGSNIESLMKHSVDRVLVQLWPSFVFAFFLLAGSPAVADRIRQRPFGTL